MAKASFSEEELQDWVYEHLANGTLLASIENLDEAIEIASAYRSDPFVSDLNGFLFSTAKLRWAEGVERIADWHTPVREVSVARTGGRPLQIDVLAQTRRLGEFVVIELKRNKDTERQAVTELTAYANALSILFPTLPPQRISLAVIATDWNHLLASALTLLLVFHRYNIVGLKTIPDAHSTKLDFKLRIVDFVALGSVRPKVIDTDSIDYLHLEIDPEELHPLLALEEITNYAKRLDLNGLCTILSKDDKTAAVCAFLMNPFRLTESYFDLVDVKLLASVLELGEEPSEVEIVDRLSNLAVLWTNQLVEIFEPFRSLAAKVGEIELQQAQVRGTLKDFLQKDYREWSIGHIQFAGIFEDFANAWRASPTALDVLRYFGELPPRKRLPFLLGRPVINLFILSEFADIGEFHDGRASLLDIFRFGRRLGRLENCAFFDTEEQYDRECQIFMISLTRCPFRVQMDLTNKSALRESCQAAIAVMFRKITESSCSFAAELFMIGYLAESQYDSMICKERGSFEVTYVVTNLDSWIDSVLRAEKAPESQSIIGYLWEKREKAVNPKSAEELAEFLNVFEYTIGKADEQYPLPWAYEEKETTLSYEMRQRIKGLLRSHSATIEHPLMIMRPNDDLSVANGDQFFDKSKDMRELWESLDHSSEFLLMNQGQGLGVFWAISYTDPSNDRRLIALDELS